MAKEVKIEAGDRVAVEYDDGVYAGVVDSIDGKKCAIGFDDGSTDECPLKDVKLINKANELDMKTDVTDTTKKASTAVSPNAQQLEKKASTLRRSKVDGANKAAATREAAIDTENAGKPLTTEEKEFMGKVEARMNGKTSRSGDNTVKTARMTSLPSSADMTRYARLVRQKEG